MPTRKLTDPMIRALESPPRGQVTFYDATLPRFGLRVSSGSARTWVVFYRFGGRMRRLSLGTYPLLKLADARAKAKEALAAVTQGDDPAAEKRAEREAPTFRELVSAYLEHHAKPKKRSWREDERMLQTYVPAAWFSMKAASITRRDIRELVESKARRTPVMANRLLACLHRTFNFGIRWDMTEANPCAMVQRPGLERSRDRVLTADEIRKVWRAAEAEDEINAALFKLYFLTAQRGGELRSIRWEDIDLEEAVWTIPGERSKNGRPHRVPLSAPAIELLRALEAGRVDDEPWVFASVGAGGYRATVAKALRRIHKASGVRDFTPHDIRRSVATHLASMGVQRLTIAKLLNHVERGITAVYERHSYDPEKRAALNAWAARLEQILSGEPARAKVIPLRA